ncbi:hypothetical protein [Planctomonas deserti]|uniref:hypothetical protein n=1 Tax=Planctomonas deserti TaxID=2144185 RepID=UPI000D3DB666|nr:hypothetical protein [Planctomonas deserti]
MTDDSRNAGDPRNETAPHTAVPVNPDTRDTDRFDTEQFPRSGGAEGTEPEFLRDDTADPAFRHDGDQRADEQPDFLRDDEHVAAAPAVPVSPRRTEDDGFTDDGFRSDDDVRGHELDGVEGDDAHQPVATPANWPLPTAEPAWPADDDVVTSSDLAAAEVPRDAHETDERGHDGHSTGAAVAATPQRDSLDELAEAEGPYIPGSYSSDTSDTSDTDASDTDTADGSREGAAVPVSADTARFDRPDDRRDDRHDGPSGVGAAVAAAGAADAVGAGSAGTAAGAQQPAAPAYAASESSQPVYLQAPVPPKKKGNRGFGVGMVLASTLVFAVLYALGVGLLLSVNNPDAFGAPLLTYLATPMFWLPVVVFFVAFALLVVLIHRANWWGFVLGGIPVAIVVYGAYLLARVMQQNIFELTPSQAVDVIERSSTFPDGILAGLLARELVIWAGAAISARARKVRARNAEARKEYERELAETPGFGPNA